VHIEPKEAGGKITIDYFSNDDLDLILDVLNRTKSSNLGAGLLSEVEAGPVEGVYPEEGKEALESLDDRNLEEKKESEEEIEDLYNLKNFSL